MGPALQALLGEAIDYAGIFPPAKLPLESAADRYARYRSEASRSLLGAFVVPIDRVDELAAVRRRLAANGDRGAWPVSVLVPSALDGTVGRLHELRDRYRAELRLDAVEVAPIAAEKVGSFARALGKGFVVSFELPLDDALEGRLRGVVEAGAQAKVRTGGITADAVPSSARVARFVVSCHQVGAAFKATAGLHHALRGPRALTYERDSPRAEMHGFLNLLVAAALVNERGLSEAELVEVLGERDASAFRFADDEVGWRDHAIGSVAIARARSEFVRSFGSCSFEEPLEELGELGLR